MTEAYPLQWPMGRPRTVSRQFGHFSKRSQKPGQSWTTHENLTIAQAMDRLRDELIRLGASRDWILSSNLTLNRDGSPKSGQRKPADPGVALYFKLDGKPICMPCDTYTEVEQNIAALAKHIEATRAIERYGVASLVEMFTGFTALPSPGAAKAWWEVLGVSQHASADEINAAWRQKAKEAHSDLGGSDAAMSEINVARDEGLRARYENA